MMGGMVRGAGSCVRILGFCSTYDRNIYTAKELWEKIGYIHRNPVRRQLVARPEEWEWSSAADYAGTRVGEPPIPVDNQELPSTW